MIGHRTPTMMLNCGMTTSFGAWRPNFNREEDLDTGAPHLDTTTGTPASGTAPFHEFLPEPPCRRPALRHSFSPLVAVSSCAPRVKLECVGASPRKGRKSGFERLSPEGTSR